jgi:phosphoribosylformylglycinamidine synthase
MCSEKGAVVDLTAFYDLRADELLFSESCGRALLATPEPEQVRAMLMRGDIPHTVIGKVGGDGLEIRLPGETLSLSVGEINASLQSLTRKMTE